MTTRKATPAKRSAPRRKVPQDHKPSLRDQLAKKRARIVTEYFPMGEEGEKALAELQRLQQQIGFAEILAIKNGTRDDGIADLQKKITEAEKARDENCLIMRFRGLSEDERDALNNEYATEDAPDEADEDELKRLTAANKAKIKEWTFEAMAAAVIDSDLTADEWREELTSTRWTAGDLIRIRIAIQSAYGAGPADSIPKD